MDSLDQLVELRRDALRHAVARVKDHRGLSLDQWTTKAGVSRSTIRQYLNGQSRSLNCETYDRLALAAGLTITELLEVERSSPLTVPISGYLGVGSEVAGYSEIISTGSDHYVDALPRLDFPQAAIVVAGEYASPRFNHGDVIYYRNVQTSALELLGQECVVRLEDGRIFVKTVLHGRGKDRFSLVSAESPVIADVGLEWAKPIAWIARKAAQTAEQMRPFGQYAALIRRSETDDIADQARRAQILEELDTLREILLSQPSAKRSAV
jgi:transcriptional regulator with XRE-family HTH domain